MLASTQPTAVPDWEVSHRAAHRPIRPGSGDHNQIAATFAEQWARVHADRPTSVASEAEARRLANTIEAYPELFRPVLLKLLGARIGRAIRNALDALATRRAS